MKKHQLCTQHPSAVLLCWLGITLLGICSLCKLDIGFYPEVSIPYATITAEFPGMPAEDVEKLVTIPLEDSISAVKNIRQISSTSKRGESIIRLEFSWNADMAVTGSDIRNRIDAAYPFLPESVSRPILSFRSLADSHIMTLAIFPDSGFTLTQASSLVKRELKSRILAQEGVAQVHITGCTEPEVQIDVNYPLLMSAPSLNFQKLADAVRKCFFRYPIGNLEEGEHRYQLRAETDIHKPEDLSQIPLDMEGAMKVGDVASVVVGERERNSFFSHNGQEGIGLRIIKTGGSSLLRTCRELRKMVEQLSLVYGNLLEIEIIEDNSKPLEHEIWNLIGTIGAGILCACIVIMFLIQNKYVAFTVIMALPFSLFPLFVCMQCTGMSLNIITLSALAVGSGMVFDNAVVVTEQLLKNRADTRCTQAVIGSTLTTIIIFIPVILLPGLMGKVFSSLAVTVILYLSISCIVSLTLTPALFTLLKNHIHINHKSFGLERWYKKYLEQIRHKKRILVLFSLAVILPYCLLFFIPFKTVPEMESDRVGIKVSFPYGYPFENYMAWTVELEEQIRKSRFCTDVTIFGGYDRDSQQDLNTFVFEMKGNGKQGLYDLFDDSGLDYQILEAENFLSVLVGDDNLYCVTLSDRAALDKEYLLIEEKAHKDKVSAVAVHGIKNCPEYRISVSENIFSAELYPADIFNAVSLAAEGCVVSQMELDGEPVDIRIRYGKEFVDSPEKIASLQIKENGKIFFTRPFIQLKKEYDYFALDRLDRQNALFLTFFPDCGNGYGARRISDRFTKVHKRDILILFSGAIVFIWFVLAIQFESCRKPFLILCTVPMGISGSLLALFVTGKSLNISSVLGLMILSGTGVNSGILILSDVVRGIPVAQAALSRLRTVCLTLLSTVVVLLPVALFDSNPIQNCASISLLGGLVFGTAVLFAFIPVLIKEESSE